MEEDEGQKQETAQGRKGDAWTEGRGRPGQVQKDAALALPSDRWMVWHFWLLSSVTG